MAQRLAVWLSSQFLGLRLSFLCLEKSNLKLKTYVQFTFKKYCKKSSSVEFHYSDSAVTFSFLIKYLGNEKDHNGPLLSTNNVCEVSNVS